MRRRVGVDGGAVEDDDALGRVGEAGRRGEGGVTSVCNTDVNIALACSDMASGSIAHNRSGLRTFESI